MKLSILKSRKFSSAIKIAMYVLIPLLILAAIYYTLDRVGYIRAFQLGLQLQQQEQQQNQDVLVLESLKKIMLLPDDIEPTMAVINDVEALKAQQPNFFANAKNGDRIIVYPTLAIIYDYEANKIIHVGPVNIEQAATEPGTDAADVNASVEDESPSEQ